MKTRILVYGDSNTWGSGADGLRYVTEKQWPNILQKHLGDGYEVIQEGLCARIAGDHDEEDLHRNGRRGYEIALRSVSPFDYLVVALGTNDLKAKYRLTTSQILEDLDWYRQRTMEYNEADFDMEKRFKDVIFVNIADYDENKFSNANHTAAKELRDQIAKIFENVIDASDLEHSEDGLHYSEADHIKIAERIYQKIKEVER